MLTYLGLDAPWWCYPNWHKPLASQNFCHVTVQKWSDRSLWSDLASCLHYPRAQVEAGPRHPHLLRAAAPEMVSSGVWHDEADSLVCRDAGLGHARLVGRDRSLL